jgi:hypothetical protein
VVHRKYTKRNGKVYGPYLYESKRVNGKVVTRYVGKDDVGEKEEGNRGRVLIYFLAVLLVLLVLFGVFSRVSLTGRVSLEVEESYKRGEILEGIVKFGVREGELVPTSSKVMVEFGDEEKEFMLWELIDMDVVRGSYYAEGVDLEGEGSGYGVSGVNRVYPEVSFDLLVYDEDGGGDGGSVPSEEEPEEEEQEEVEAEEELEEEIEEEEEEQEEEEVEEQEEVGEDEEEEPEEEQEEEGESPITGSVIAESGWYVSGTVSKGEEFSYDLEEGKLASIRPGSVKVEGESIDDDEISLKVKKGEVVVSTDYFIEEEGFGEEFLGKKVLSLQINLVSFDLEVEENVDLSVKLVYGEEIIAEVEKRIVVEEVEEEVEEEEEIEEPEEEVNETIVNETIVNETLVNGTMVNVSLSVVKGIPMVRVEKDGSYVLDLSEYFVGAERYEFFADDLRGVLMDDRLEIFPNSSFTGARKGRVDAYSGNESVSVEFMVLVSSLNISKVKGVVGEKVKWEENVSVPAGNVTVELPGLASNVNVKKVEKGEEDFDLTDEANVTITGGVIFRDEGDFGKEPAIVGFFRRLLRLTGFAVEEGEEADEKVEVVIEGDEEADYSIGYETPAPEKTEETRDNRKRVVVSGPEEPNYTEEGLVFIGWRT